MTAVENPLHWLQALDSILSTIQSSQGLEPCVLRKLYHVLVSLSQDVSCFTEIMRIEPKWVLSNLRMITSVTFDELSKRLKLQFSALHVASALQSGSNPNLWAAAEELNLLLRCCLVILILLESDQRLLFEKCEALLAILGKLCSPDLLGEDERHAFSLRASREANFTGDNGSASFSEDFVASFSFEDLSDPCIPFLCKVLEVFLDELLIRRPLRKYFLFVDSVSSRSEMLFTHHKGFLESQTVVELLSAHFFLSVSEDQAFEKFITGLSCVHGNNSRMLELHVNAAVSLLHNPIMSSAPRFVQAHLISLVSDAISVPSNSEPTGPDPRFMNCCLSAFEKSVMLYRSHMCDMWMNGQRTGERDSYANSSLSCLSFESNIQEETKHKISRQVAKLDSLWHAYLCSMLSKTRTDLLAASKAFMKGNEHVLDENCKDDISCILHCAVIRALPDAADDTSLQKLGKTSAEDIILLASILKLMSCSLLQAVRAIRYGGNMSSPSLLKEIISCKEYDFLVDVIDSFQHLKVQLPIQKFLHDALNSHLTSHKESKLMFLHFTGLLSLSFYSGFEFLVKGSISIMMAIMNLFTFEEGNLDNLRSTLAPRSDSFSSDFCSNDFQEAPGSQESIRAIASKFQRIRMRTARDPSGSENRSANARKNASLAPRGLIGIEDETEETCSGEVFLKCIISDKQDIDDLASFIECSPEKDYTSWLKNRKKYRKWKSGRKAVVRWKKSKKSRISIRRS